MYLKKMCEAGELGEIYYARAQAVRRRAVPTWGVFLDAENQGGGPLIDIGTHALDLTLWEMDNYEPAMVVGSVFRKLADTENAANAWGPWDPKKFTVEDSAFGFVKMKNGALINIRCSWALNLIPKEGMVRLCGTKGGLDTAGFSDVVANHVVANRCVDSKIATRSPFPRMAGTIDRNPMLSPQDAEAKIWVDALYGQGELFVTPEQALTVTKILDAIYESARTGETIYF
jgi:predicted dehydrogenase